MTTSPPQSTSPTSSPSVGPWLRGMSAVITLVAVTVGPGKARAGNAQDARVLAKRAMTETRSKGQAGYSKAASLFLTAYDLDPETHEYLYSAARLEELVGKNAEAKRHYETFLERSDKGHALRGRARKGLQRTSELLSLAPPERDWRRRVGWGCVAVGGLSAALGLWVYFSADGDVADLNRKLGQQEAGLVTGISYSEARDEKARLESDLRLGGVTVGLGAVAMIAGGVLVATAPASKWAFGVPPGQWGLLASRRF